MKYICTIDDNGKLEIFTFPRFVNHDCMAEVLGRIKDHTHGDWTRLHREPISAGFVDNIGNCYGESESLMIESRPEEDTLLLANQLNM